MKVYVITSGEYSDYGIRAVALSREKAVENYMKENPVEVNTDKTLSEPGKAADAKETGDAISGKASGKKVCG